MGISEVLNAHLSSQSNCNIANENASDKAFDDLFKLLKAVQGAQKAFRTHQLTFELANIHAEWMPNECWKHAPTATGRGEQKMSA